MRRGSSRSTPDLYHGELARHTEMDKAARLMTAMPPDRAARDMIGAVDYLAAHPAVQGDQLGAIGFCMGGMLTLILAALRPDRIAAAVPFYGFPQGEMEPDWARLDGRRTRAHGRERRLLRPRRRACAGGEAAGTRQGRPVHRAPGYRARVHGPAQRARHARRRGRGRDLARASSPSSTSSSAEASAARVLGTVAVALLAAATVVRRRRVRRRAHGESRDRHHDERPRRRARAARPCPRPRSPRRRPSRSPPSRQPHRS